MADGGWNDLSRHCSYGARNGARIAAAYRTARTASAVAPRGERKVCGSRFLQKNTAAQPSPATNSTHNTAAAAMSTANDADFKNSRNAGYVSEAHVSAAAARAANAVNIAIAFVGAFSRSSLIRGAASARRISANSCPTTSIAQPITTPAITTYWSCFIIAAYISCPSPG